MNIRARLQHIMHDCKGHLSYLACSAKRVGSWASLVKRTERRVGDPRQKAGIVFLLMIVLLAAFLSIAMGIINILLGQIFIVGQAGESFHAFYASDIGMERTLYRDRIQNLCSSGCAESRTLVPENSCYTSTLIIGPSVGCLGPSTRCIIVKAQNNCVGQRYVERDFDIKY